MMANENTAVLPPLYKDPKPLIAGQHSNLRLKSHNKFDFAKNSNSAIVTLTEVPAAARSYPIVFTKHEEEVQPVAVLGFENNKNSMVDNKGQWKKNTYIPAYIRRYPFIFFEDAESDVLTLCADMDSSSISEIKGDLLFEDNEPTEAAKIALNFCEMFHKEMLATKPLCKAIDEADLLENRTASIKTKGSNSKSLTGFLTISEEKLNKLDDDAFIKLRSAGALPLIYSHLLSMRSWHNI